MSVKKKTTKTKSLLAPKNKQAIASLERLKTIFTVPEGDHSTLSIIEKEISENLSGFLSSHVAAEVGAPADLEKDFTDTEIPEHPIFVSEQADFLLKKVVAQSVHTASPNFIGHMTSAIPYFMLPLTKIMIALNQNLVKMETSKAFTPLERQVVGMLHRLVYQNSAEFYKDRTHSRQNSIGNFCSGGTVANITALWVARNLRLGPKAGFAGIQEEGFAAAMSAYKCSNLVVLVSERAHYSLSKAADLIGLGKRQLIKIRTSDNFKVSVPEIESTLKELKARNTFILAIVGVAGSTETGHVDDLQSLAELAQLHNIYFHVDAAWGGPTLFSTTHRDILKGIELADSVTMDAHKQFYTPMGSAVALFRDPNALNSIESSADYIIRKGSRDIGKRTLEGSRPGNAMLVHSALRIFGRSGYEILIDRGIRIARCFAELIDQDPDFELISPPELNILTYRYIPANLQETLTKASPDRRSQINTWINNLTRHIQREQRAEGKTFVSRTTLNPTRYNRSPIVVFRAVLANPLTDEQVLRAVLTEQKKLAERALSGPFKDSYRDTLECS